MLNDIYQHLDPVAFAIGPFSVRWYGLAYLAGFFLAGFIIYKTAKRWKVNLDVDSLSTIVISVVVGILLGGRLGYCLFYGDGYYFQNPVEILHVNNGGMSFHGALFLGSVAGILACRHLKMPVLTFADLACVGVPLGLFFGRLANFVNGELWGAPTDLAIGVVFGGNAGTMPRHPSQLYEAFLEGIVIFVVMFALSRKVPPRKQGTFSGLFLLLYGVFRIAVEFVREPDVQIGYLYGGWLTMGMVLSIPLVLLGIALLIYAKITKRDQCGILNSVELSETEAKEIEMLKFYKCKHCGNVVLKLVDGGAPMTCCGETMEEMEPNSSGAAPEKHLPVVNKFDDRIEVEVSDVEHPMTEEHMIDFIAIDKGCGTYIKPLDPGKPAQAKFYTKHPGAVRAVYEYCNLHGLWKTEL